MERIGKLSDDKDKLLAILESLKEAGTSPPTGDGLSLIHIFNNEGSFCA